MMDTVTRILVLVLGVALLVCYRAQTENGHYQLYYSDTGPALLDTRTGDFYRGNTGVWVKVYVIK